MSIAIVIVLSEQTGISFCLSSFPEVY